VQIVPALRALPMEAIRHARMAAFRPRASWRDIDAKKRRPILRSARMHSGIGMATTPAQNGGTKEPTPSGADNAIKKSAKYFTQSLEAIGFESANIFQTLTITIQRTPSAPKNKIYLLNYEIYFKYLIPFWRAVEFDRFFPAENFVTDHFTPPKTGKLSVL
jgi:hypothetical protein